MPRLRRGQLHSRVEDVDNQDIIAGGVPAHLWLMKVLVELSPRNTVTSAASVIQLDTTNKCALIRNAIKHNKKSVHDKEELGEERGLNVRERQLPSQSFTDVVKCDKKEEVNRRDDVRKETSKLVLEKS
ncbi:hypothetical protein LWI28_006583 [Acer negundo]|uniref:Uncharacterized protein n=1 Tax=Acer negundo TaxID=4023 RepID=A0AAD5NRP6_ACENE|nr:hypothetical protein LWI28_006583 [Acer negundo]